MAGKITNFSKRMRKAISLFVCLMFVFTQTGFAQMAAELNIGSYFSQMHSGFNAEKFRPLHIRYFSYDINSNNFKFLFDKGDLKDLNDEQFQASANELLKYFLIGIAIPDKKFWVNLRPDLQDQIIESELENTDLGKVFLEADLQLKKDTATMTSPGTKEGREYWDKLYNKAEELFGYQNITIPTLTRPWIVPGEIIVRETEESAFIYKSSLKVMLEQDHLKGSVVYDFKDERMKALNEYSSYLIREFIIPKLTKEVNTAKRYAPLRQAFYSLILSRWFKARFSGQHGLYSSQVDSGNLDGLTSKNNWSKTIYFKEYQKSFNDGEYNIQEPVYTPTGQVIRSYFSGGVNVSDKMILTGMSAASSSLNLVNAFKRSLKSLLLVTVVGSLLGIGPNSVIPEVNAQQPKEPPGIIKQEDYPSPFSNVAKILGVPLDFNHPKHDSPLYLGSLAKFKGKIVPVYWASRSGPYYLLSEDGLISIGEKFKPIYVDNYEGNIPLEEAEKILNKEIILPPNPSSEQKKKEISSIHIANVYSGALFSLIEQYQNHKKANDSDYKEITKDTDLMDLLDNLEVSYIEKGIPGGTGIKYKNSDLIWTKPKGGFFKNEKTGVVEITITGGTFDYDKARLSYNSDTSLILITNKGKAFIIKWTWNESKKEMDFEVSSESGYTMQKVMTYEEIDKQIDRIPKSARPYIGFGLSREKDGKPVLLIRQYEDLMFTKPLKNEYLQADNIILFFANNGNVYIKALGEIPGAIEYTEIRKDGYDIWDDKNVPANIRQFIDNMGNPAKESGSSLIPIDKSTNSTTTIKSEAINPGGIDFRVMNIVTWPMTGLSSLNLKLPQLSNLSEYNLDEEFQQIQNLLNAGMVPLGERIKEYLAACKLKGEWDNRIGDIFACLVEICKIDEDNASETSCEIKEAIILSDS